jgi:O-methyltransferase
VTAIKKPLIRLMIECLFRFGPTREMLYKPQPFPRWPYMFSPLQMEMLSNLLLSVNVPGAVVEIGCNQGWLSVFLLKVMKEVGVSRPYVGIDTFAGFQEADIEAEYKRGKPQGIYDYEFKICKREWYETSLKHGGFTNTRAFKADASTFDYGSLSPIAFALVDVDLYRPVLLALRGLWQYVAPGGLVAVDDCDPNHRLWDGAYHAYKEFCSEMKLAPELMCGKLGVLRKPFTAPE